MDEYRDWLQEQVVIYTKRVMDDAIAMGRPTQPQFADQAMRYELEAYEWCLEKYNELNPPAPSVSED